MNIFLKEWQRKSSRIVVFAGVFDPVHRGHIETARRSLRFHGSKVLFLPEKVPQHKHSSTDYAHRLQMLLIALADEPNMDVANSPFDNHTIDQTLPWLQEQFPDTSFMLLVGSDVAAYMHTWTGIEKIKDYSVEAVIVAARGNEPFAELKKQVPIKRLKSSHKTMSSSRIRQDITSRHTSLTKEVHNYIKQNNLYKTPTK